MKHTDTPWNVSTWIEQPNNRTKPMIAARGVTIAITHPSPICREDKCEANARHIVHCVNNHEKLVEALGRLSDVVDAGPEYKVSMAKERISAIEQARALLAALEAEEGGEL